MAARIGALLADRSACGACIRVDIGATKHRVGTGAANVGTRSQQGDVAFGGEFAAFGQAIADCLDAERMAFRAIGDALVHFRAAMLGRMMSHGCTPTGKPKVRITPLAQTQRNEIQRPKQSSHT